MRCSHWLYGIGSCVAVAVAGAGGPAGAAAGEWSGRIEMRDGVEHVFNPATPMEAPLVHTIEELWRIGGDTDAEGEFFGVIGGIATDAEGNVFVLDRQLSEVKVFSPDGGYLRTIGREGEGPGEFRNPIDMFILPDGNIGVLQLAPGRLVMLTPDGEPRGDHPLPDPDSGQTPTLVSGRTMGDRVLLVFSENKMQEGRVDITRVLAMIDSEGNEVKRILESTRTLEFVNFLFDETVWRTFDNRWRVGPNERLYAPERYLDYEIVVWNASGERERVIHRDYEHWDRTQEQETEMYDIFDAMLQNQLPQYTIEVGDHDPDITNLNPRIDGTLWVLTSRGTRVPAEGALGVFDVFDGDGRYLREVTLLGEGEPMGDGYIFADDRLFVITDLLEANIASRGGRKGDVETEEEPEPITIICYDLEPLAAEN